MPIIREKYNTGDDNNNGGYIDDTLPDRKIAQTFLAEYNYTIYSVKLKLFRTATPGDITISIKATAAGLPTGADLCSGTLHADSITTFSGGDWYEITLGSGTSIVVGTTYAIVMSRVSVFDVGDRVTWRTEFNGGGASYTGGSIAYANDGSTWTAQLTRDAMFECYKTSLIVTTQACTDTIAEKSTGHGTITVLGDSLVTQHGHCWATTSGPTTADSKTLMGQAPNAGQFSWEITGLVPGTTYYVRAYATDSDGTVYGDDVTIICGSTIGHREWWTGGQYFHYFDEYGVERSVLGVAAGGFE